MRCTCFIVPDSVLAKLERDRDLTAESRRAMGDTRQIDQMLRRIRTLHGTATKKSGLMATTALVSLATSPTVSVYDAKHLTSLPGTPVSSPGSSADITAKRAFDTTTDVAKFYKACFNRNSIDGNGLALVSTIHYGVDYNNAFWDGTQMVYGDGDNNIFIDFTASDDVIGHELTHGVTQYTGQLAYTNEAGGLNESISDVFGSLFLQWRNQQSVKAASWLIGAGIMGPAAKKAGYTCLRDLANPAAQHCLAPQPTNYSQYQNGMDPHESSGIPNFAFYKAAMALGGNAWDRAGKIWYDALTGGKVTPNMKFKGFADLTRRSAQTLYPGNASVYAAVDAAWKAVGVP